MRGRWTPSSSPASTTRDCSRPAPSRKAHPRHRRGRFLEAIAADRRFAVVTTLGVSVPVIAGNVAAYGFAGHCVGVTASDVPVLDLEHEGSASREKVAAEIARVIAALEPDAIVLGCAGMADLAEDYARRFQIPVIDGVAAAVRILEMRDGQSLKGATFGISSRLA